MFGFLFCELPIAASKQVFLEDLLYVSFYVHGCRSKVFVCRFNNNVFIGFQILQHFFLYWGQVVEVDFLVACDKFLLSIFE